jgi:hypothetical protein
MIINADWIRENYLKYNEIAFGGKLPTNIKFSASKRLKNSAGYASYIMHRDSGTISDICLTIASSFDNNEDAHLCTLLHEMIHIEDYVFNVEHFLVKNEYGNGYEYVKNYDAHGEWFLGECARINSMNLIKYKLSQKQTAEETSNEVDVREYSTRVCILYSKTDDPSDVCVIYKTNENGMKYQVNFINGEMPYFKKNFFKVEWYNQSNDKVGSLAAYPNNSKFNKYLFKISESSKNNFIEKHGLILVHKIELDSTFKRNKISDEKYASNLDWNLEWAIKCIRKSPDFKSTGVRTYTTKDSVNDISIQVSVNKKKDIIEVLFNGGNPLYIKFKEYLNTTKSSFYFFDKTYGKMILNHLRNNGIIQESKMLSYKFIIREVIEEYLDKDSTENYGNNVSNVVGQRQLEKEIDNNTILGITE